MLLKNKLCIQKKSTTATGRLYIRLDEKYIHTSYALSDVVEDTHKKSLIIHLGTGDKNVSYRKEKEKTCGLIDLRQKSIKEAFKDCHLLIKIYDDTIVIEGTKDDAYVGEIILDKAVGEDCSAMSQFVKRTLNNVPGACFNQISDQLAEGLTVASLFSGMGGLDYAFLIKNFNLVFAIDKPFYKETDSNIKLYGKHHCSVLEDYHIQTYKYNIGNHIIAHDILDYPIDDIPKANIYIAGIPCQELSSVSPKRNQFVMLPRFFNRFIEIIHQARDTCEVFVIENSSNLLSAGKQFIEQLKKELPWFTITENSVDAALFGSAQHRKRAIVIGCTKGAIELKPPALTIVRNVGDALSDLTDTIPNQLDYSVPKEQTALRMSYVPEGGNGFDMPECMRTGKFANSYKRLNSKDKACAIANVRKSCIMPPYADRILSIRECLRLFDLPDSFICHGTLAAKQQMVANSVPLMLGKAIANAILKFYIKERY